MIYPTKKRPPSKQALKRLAGIKAASAELGPLIVRKPAGLRVDGSPLLQPGEVYVSQWGMKYHPGWCEAIATKWDHAGKGVFVTLLSDVGRRAECGLCAAPLTGADVPRKTSTEQLDAEYARKKARLAAGERRRNGG